MAVEGKTILQTPERTELTGKEGIPFQEGERNGHVLLEKIKEYIHREGSSNSNVHLFKGVCDIDKSSNPAEIKEALGVDSVNDLMMSAKKGTVFIDETNDSRYNTCSVYVLNNVIMISWLESEYPGLTNLKLNVSDSSSGDVFSFNSIEDLTIPLVEDNLNSEHPDSALSSNQGRILNDKIAEISNPASAEKDGLMSKEDKKAFDSIQFSKGENSVQFDGKKYGALHLMRVENLSNSSTSSEIAAVIGEATEANFTAIVNFVSRGGLFIVQDNWREYAAVPNYNSSGDKRYVQFEYINLYENNTEKKRIRFDFNGSSWSFNVSKSKITEVVDNLDSSNSTLALSANQGRILDRKIFEFSGTIHEGMTSFEESFYEIDEAIDGGALFTGVVEYGGESYKLVLASYRSENVPPFVSYKFVSSVFGNGIYCVVTATKNENQGGQLGDFTVKMVELSPTNLVSGFQSEISALRDEIEALKGSGA